MKITLFITITRHVSRLPESKFLRYCSRSLACALLLLASLLTYWSDVILNDRHSETQSTSLPYNACVLMARARTRRRHRRDSIVVIRLPKTITPCRPNGTPPKWGYFVILTHHLRTVASIRLHNTLHTLRIDALNGTFQLWHVHNHSTVIRPTTILQSSITKVCQYLSFCANGTTIQSIHEPLLLVPWVRKNRIDAIFKCPCFWS